MFRPWVRFMCILKLPRRWRLRLIGRQGEFLPFLFFGWPAKTTTLTRFVGFFGVARLWPLGIAPGKPFAAAWLRPCPWRRQSRHGLTQALFPSRFVWPRSAAKRPIGLLPTWQRLPEGCLPITIQRFWCSMPQTQCLRRLQDHFGRTRLPTRPFIAVQKKPPSPGLVPNRRFPSGSPRFLRSTTKAKDFALIEMMKDSGFVPTVLPWAAIVTWPLGRRRIRRR